MAYQPSELEQSLVSGYSKLMDPQVEASQQGLKGALAGGKGLWGSGYGKGLGGIEAQKLASVGQYAQQLPFQTAGLTGYLGNQATLPKQQMQQQASQFGQNLGLQQQQLAQQGTQFGQNLALQKLLGLGSQGLQQQQITNQAGQFGQQFGLSQEQQALQKALGMGGLGIQQAQQAAQEAQFGQQFGLSQEQQALQKVLGMGGLGIQQAQQTAQESQFGQQFGLSQEQLAANIAAQQASTGLAGQQQNWLEQMQQAGLTGQYGGKETLQASLAQKPYDQMTAYEKEAVSAAQNKQALEQSQQQAANIQAIAQMLNLGQGMQNLGGGAWDWIQQAFQGQ